MSDEQYAPVFEALGRAIRDSQVLEAILVDQSIAHDLDSKKLAGPAIKTLEQKLGKKALGDLIEIWESKDTRHATPARWLDGIRKDRNYLAHRIFRESKSKSVDEFLHEIEKLSARIRAAHALIFAYDPDARREVDAGWGSDDDDRG
jgi:hypothetical protein